METLEKVATPATAFTVVVPPSTAPPGFDTTPSVTAPVKPATVLPCASRTATTGDGVIACPAMVLPGCVLNASWLAAPGKMSNGAVVALVSDPLDATNVNAVPTLLSESPVNVATPATAFTDAAPTSDAPTAFAPSATETTPENDVAVLPFASCTLMTTFANDVPTMPLVGCCVTASFTGAATVAVALNVAEPATPAAVAVSV